MWAWRDGAEWKRWSSLFWLLADHGFWLLTWDDGGFRENNEILCRYISYTVLHTLFETGTQYFRVF
jgi:hypothetical protein